MTTLVVDASVAAKWFFAENDSAASRRLISSRRRLLAPDLIWAEFGNVLWKRVQRSEITSAQASSMVDDFLRMPLEIAASGPLLPLAFEVAATTRRTVYDCIYLSLAIRHECKLVTADARLFNALRDTTLGKHVRLVASAR